MKRTHKTLAWLSLIALLLSLWTPMAASAETATDTPAATEPLPYAQPQRDDVLYAGGELLERLDNGEALRYIYDHIIDGLVSGQDGVDIPLNGYTITEDELKVVRSVLNAIVPDYYGKGTGEFLYSDLNDTLYEDRLSCQFWSYSSGNHPEIEAQVYQRVHDLTYDLADKSDYEKSRILFERLVCVNYYEATPNDQTAYGALVEGKSVCSGYARAYQLLMQAVGIPCFYIIGFGGKEAHAWNLVRLDGQWYYSDPTWGDHTDSSIGIVYKYLNCTYDAFVDGGHIFLEDWVPRTTATDANYYYRNRIECATLSLQQMIDLLRVNNPLTLQITGDRDAIANLFWDNHETIAAAIGLEQWSTVSCGYRYDQLLVLEILGEHTHDYQSFTIHPVCVAGGYTHHYCTECSDWYRDDATSLLGHDDTHYPAQTPSCVEQGWDAYTVCNRCGYSTQEKVWGECRTVVSEVVEATCTSRGYSMHVCTVCGLGYLRDVVPALGHEMGTCPAKEPTSCLEPGWEAYEGCLRCGKGERDFIWGDHQWETIEKWEPTCDRQGYTHERCTLCGSENFAYSDRLWHQMVSYPAKEPTCLEYGWDAYKACAICGYSTIRYLYGQCNFETTVTEPTCTEQGYTHYQCTLCGRHHNDDYVDPIGHNPSEEWWHNQYGHGHPCLNQCGGIVDFTFHSDPCDVCGYSTAPAILYGDANGDGKVNNRDLGLLQLYLNDDDLGDKTFDLLAVDLDGNGKINNRDLGLLQKMLNQ